MDLSSFPLATLPPRRLSARSAWIEHIPFAFALMDILRPRSLVELGTHMGDSFCAFCQAAAELRLDVACTAIDTWQGDAHTGPTRGEVLPALRVHCAAYPFARLLQSTFDDARPSFADGSVDLLHIDGLHTYEAVRHDYETWLPTLSRRGVILFHDTRATHDDFGVHRLWKEIQGRHPTFEFHHGYGLGVVAAGPDIDPRVAEFLAWTNAHPVAARAFFAGLGGRLLLAYTLAHVDALQNKAPDQDVAQAAAALLDSYDLRTRTEALVQTVRRAGKRSWKGLLSPRRGGSVSRLPITGPQPLASHTTPTKGR